jgi:hypothetical protein
MTVTRWRWCRLSRAARRSGRSRLELVSEEGRNAGVWSVGVLTSAGSREELEAAGADRVVESIRDLPALLGVG